MSKSAYQTSKIFDLDVFGSDIDSLLTLAATHLQQGAGLLTMVTPNPEQIVLSRSDQHFLHHLQSADVRLPDGIGLVLAAQARHALKGSPTIEQRITGVEVAERLLELAQQHGYVVLVIGGRDYASETPAPSSLAKLGLARLRLNQSAHETPNPWYWLEAYHQAASPQPDEEATITQVIQQLQPDLVFVALGAPLQEAWLADHRQLLAENQVKIAMVVGGAFDILLNTVPRAPVWMRKLGLEWLFRLQRQPWRWRRQLKLFQFVKLAFHELGFF